MKDNFRVSDLAENTDKGLDKFNGENDNIIQKENRKLLTLWIGKNADKILNINMNIAVLFLGELYYFYRKMYIEGLIVLLIKIITFIFVPYKYLIVVYNMILFFITNNIYKSHIIRNIKKLKPNYSSSKLEVECKKRGGVNNHIFVILLVIELLGFSYYVYKNTNITDYFNKNKTVTTKKKEKPTESKSEKKTKFDGKLEIVPLEANVLDFGFPSYWNMNKSKAYYNFDETKKDAKCSVEIGTVKGENNARELAQKVKSYFDINTMTTAEKNTIKWYRFRKVKDGTTIYAFSQKGEDVLVYKFTIEKNAPDEKCKQIEREIFDLIKPMGYVESKYSFDE